MDDAQHDRVMARCLAVKPNDMTFEDGVRICQFMTSFQVMFRQAENGQPAPNLEKLAQLDAAAEQCLKVREALIALWKQLIYQHQPTLLECCALISATPERRQ